MTANSTQSHAPAPERLFCLMARVATTTTTASLIASASPTLLLEEDDDHGVILVEDEHGTEFKFSDVESSAISLSGVAIGEIEAAVEEAVGDRDRVDCDFADAFPHAPLTVDELAYLPLPPSAEGLVYSGYVDPRSHGQNATKNELKLIENEVGKVGSNLVKIDDFNAMMTLDYAPMTHNDLVGGVSRFSDFILTSETAGLVTYRDIKNGHDASGVINGRFGDVAWCNRDGRGVAWHRTGVRRGLVQVAIRKPHRHDAA